MFSIRGHQNGEVVLDHAREQCAILESALALVTY